LVIKCVLLHFCLPCVDNTEEAIRVNNISQILKIGPMTGSFRLT